MRFVEGNKLSTGRPKGSLNKKTMLKVKELMLAKGINPVEKLLELIPHLKPAQQKALWENLLTYCDAKKVMGKVDTKDEQQAVPLATSATDSLMQVLFKSDTDGKEKTDA